MTVIRLSKSIKIKKNIVKIFLLKKLPPYATYGFNLCMQLHYHIWMKRWCLYATPIGHIVKICKYKFGNPAQLAINTLYEEVR
jgi:hypothetical protein